MMWDSQPEWGRRDSDELTQMFDDGAPVDVIAGRLQRSVVGVEAKLTFLSRKRITNRPFNSHPIVYDKSTAKTTAL